MDKEEKYNNRMRLPKEGAILAENDNILLKAVLGGIDVKIILFEKNTDI